MERELEQTDWDLIDRYLAGECNTAEADAIRSYLSVNRGLESGLRAGVDRGSQKTKVDIENNWAAMQKRMLASDSAGLMKTATLSNVWPRVAGLALAIAIVVVGVKYVPATQHTSLKSQTYGTGKAQRANITLDDGTLVTLAPATEITVTGRNVKLAGEALFTVINNTGNPFTVRTGNTIAKVLGTTFSVRSYKDELNTRVVVSEGRVSANNTVMSPGDVAVVTATNTQLRHNVDVNAILGWKDGKLYFNDVRLVDAVPELERWYNVSIRVADDEIRQSMLDGTLTARNAEELAYTLEFTLKARVERKGNVLTLYRNTPLARP